jgi:hypothetical protein
MSPRKSGYEVVTRPYRLTAAEIQRLEYFAKRVYDSKWTVPCAIAAAIGAALEGIHIIWLAIRYCFKF